MDWYAITFYVRDRQAELQRDGERAAATARYGKRDLPRAVRRSRSLPSGQAPANAGVLHADGPRGPTLIPRATIVASRPKVAGAILSSFGWVLRALRAPRMLVRGRKGA